MNIIKKKKKKTKIDTKSVIQTLFREMQFIKKNSNTHCFLKQLHKII